MKLLDEALGSPIPPAEHYVTEDVTRMMEVTRPVDSTVHKKILQNFEMKEVWDQDKIGKTDGPHQIFMAAIKIFELPCYALGSNFTDHYFICGN